MYCLKCVNETSSHQFSGEVIPEGDPDEFIFWDIVDGVNYFLESSKDVLMKTFPFLRYLPGKNKRVYDKVVHAKQRVIERYIMPQKVNMNK